jgi:hypothetical protein
MVKKIYRFYTYAKKDGLSGALLKTKGYISRKSQPFIRQPIDVMASIEDVMNADYINHPYKRPAAKKIKDGKMKIAWVLSAISKGSGGQNTIVRFARYLKEHGHDITFYIYEGIQPQSSSEAKQILKESFNFDVKVKKIANYEESDVLFATGWETAYPVFNIKTDAHKFYFVQDFEPYFYGLGSRYILAENTYKMGFYGITAGKWLTKKVSEYGMSADYFDFGADMDIYRPKSDIKKQNKICFYARPVTERRAFELGIIALEKFHKKHPEYTIEFVGWDVSSYDIPFPYINRGIVSHSELAKIYHESKACLCLSLTNVSLLPLELLAAGCIPVLNEGENNSMVLGENKYISYSPASPIQLADELSKIVSRKDIDKYSKKASESVKSSSWDKSYQKVEEILLREIRNG